MAGLREMKGSLQFAGDCRNDSPGQSAKYGTYTLVEQMTKKVIDLQLIQVIKKIMQIRSQDTHKLLFMCGPVLLSVVVRALGLWRQTTADREIFGDTHPTSGGSTQDEDKVSL